MHLQICGIVYALALILIGIISFMMSYKKIVNPKIKWSGMALFGTCYGAYVAIEFYSKINDFNMKPFSILVIIAIFGLMEFIRTHEETYGLIKLKPYQMHIPLLLTLTFLAMITSDFKTVINVFLDVGLFWAVFCVYRKYKFEKENKTKNILKVIGIFLSLTLISNIFQTINPTDIVFMLKDSYQIILFRIHVLLVFSLAIGLIMLAQRYGLQKYKGQEKDLKRVTKFGLLIIIITIVGGVLYISQYGNTYHEKVHLEFDAELNYILQEFNSMSERIIDNVEIVSTSQRVKNYILDKTEDNYKKASEHLDSIKTATKNSVIYIMDTEGNTILTTNRDEETSFLNKNYAFRPYFIDAINGKVGQYYALGVTSMVRGAYYSYPIYENNEIIGVAVVKNNVDEFVSIFRYYEDAYLVSPEGVIFISGKPEILYKSFFEISPNIKKELLESKQFGDVHIESLNYSYINEGVFKDSRGLTLMVQKGQTNIPNWNIILLKDYMDFEKGRFNSTGLFFIFMIFEFLVFVGLFGYSLDNIIIKSSEVKYKRLFEKAVEDYKKTEENSKKKLEDEVKKKTKELALKLEKEAKTTKAMLYILEKSKKSNDELNKNKKILQEKNKELTIAKIKLNRFNANLEKKVNLRTNELEKALESIKNANKELKKLDHAKSEFIAIASHELRTPLTSIIGFIELLMNEPEILKDTKKSKKLLNLSFGEARKLHRLINDILNLSKMESGKMTFNFKKSSIREIIKSVYNEGKILAQKKGVRLSYKIDENIPQMFIDPGKIEEAISNLVNNALKILESGQLVEILAKKINKDVSISIKDNGPGIPKNKLNEIFRPFVQVESAAKHHEGTGLGLVIAKDIVLAHKGKLTVESKEKEGTCFKIIIPFKR